jgi:hypothetical protein
LVDPEPLVIVSYKHQGEIISKEVVPIAYDESGFDIDAPVYGKNYKREPDTQREKNARELDALDSNGPAHSFINASSAFIKQRTGEQVAIEGGITIHELLISQVEFAKRLKARLGFLPDGLMDQMKKDYPGGIPEHLVDNAAHEYEPTVRVANGL